MPPSLTLYLEGPLAREALATLAPATGIKAQELPPSEAPTRDDLLSLTANLLEITFAVGFVAEKLYVWYQQFRQGDTSTRLTCIIEAPDGSRLNLNSATPEEIAAILQVIERGIRLLRHPQLYGIVLHGTGGLGKSSVVSRWADRLRRDFLMVPVFGLCDELALTRALANQSWRASPVVAAEDLHDPTNAQLAVSVVSPGPERSVRLHSHDVRSSRRDVLPVDADPHRGGLIHRRPVPQLAVVVVSPRPERSVCLQGQAVKPSRGNVVPIGARANAHRGRLIRRRPIPQLSRVVVSPRPE